MHEKIIFIYTPMALETRHAKHRKFATCSTSTLPFAVAAQITPVDSNLTVKILTCFLLCLICDQLAKSLMIIGGCSEIDANKSAVHRAVLPAATCSINRSCLIIDNRSFFMLIPVNFLSYPVQPHFFNE